MKTHPRLIVLTHNPALLQKCIEFYGHPYNDQQEDNSAEENIHSGTGSPLTHSGADKICQHQKYVNGPLQRQMKSASGILLKKSKCSPLNENKINHTRLYQCSVDHLNRNRRAFGGRLISRTQNCKSMISYGVENEQVPEN